MLIHGRLLLTHNYIMLDEVRSLLQKSLRRQSPLAFQATKELLGYEKDQLPWKSIVTFIFEDHCLNNIDFFKTLYGLYERGDKYKCIELIHRGYTCRHAACLQVVALADDYHPVHECFKTDISTDPSLKGLAISEPDKIDIDLLLTNIVKFWKDGNVKALAKLFAIVNMVAKIEKRKLTREGEKYLITSIKKGATVYHLVLSVLFKHTEVGYMKELIKICYKFALVLDVPQGLILFTVLSNLEYKATAIDAKVDCTNLGTIDWDVVQKLEKMPSWAVDKHTFRGKFGKESRHILMRKFYNVSPLCEAELEEFHGLRPKSDLKTFFETGCVCTNDILAQNPIWEDTKNMYFKQKPSQQKTAKITQAVYNSYRTNRNVIFGSPTAENILTNQQEKQSVAQQSNVQPTHSKSDHTSNKRKNSSVTNVDDKKAKKQRLDTASVSISRDGVETGPSGPLLQLPTGSAKVYTRLDDTTGKVWKGPYKNIDKLNLCMFFHKAMTDIFKDIHTLELEQRGNYLLFPLIQLREGQKPDTITKAYYDCISKTEVREENGRFVERSSLGIIQLHKLEPGVLSQLPVSIWAHFAYRFLLNVGDSGLYNAIVTTDLRQLYGIDMEENRAQVKGSGLFELMFVKHPSKKLREAIKNIILSNVEEFSALVNRDFDFTGLEKMYLSFGIKNETERCKSRLQDLKCALDKFCQKSIGV